MGGDTNYLGGYIVVLPFGRYTHRFPFVTVHSICKRIERIFQFCYSVEQKSIFFGKIFICVAQLEKFDHFAARFIHFPDHGIGGRKQNAPLIALVSGYQNQ